MDLEVTSALRPCLFPCQQSSLGDIGVGKPIQGEQFMCMSPALGLRLAMEWLFILAFCHVSTSARQRGADSAKH
jgi:hypothetical protein